MGSTAQLRSLLKQVLHLQESPHRTALAFAVGIFIAFSPTYGLHTLSVIFCAWAFRLNFIAVLVGSLINNPWTLVPILGATFWTGFQLFGAPSSAPFNLDDLSLQSLYEQIRPYALHFLVGGLTLSLIGSVLSYPAAYLFISQYRARFCSARGQHEQLPPGAGLG
jgi:uncharacterized protein (DUF2062 family)